MTSNRTKEDIERIIAEDEARLTAMSDDDIDYSDIPPVTDWSGGVRGRFFRPRKDQITLRLDADILDWFRRNEDQYQTAINAALREHVQRRTAKTRNTA